MSTNTTIAANASDTDISYDVGLPSSWGTLIACFCMILIFMHTSILIVCYKRLKEEFRNLLVLALSYSEIFKYGSFLWQIVSIRFSFVSQSSLSCLLTFVMSDFGALVSNEFTLVFCMERWLTVEYFNFGIQQALNRFKYVIIFGTVGFALLISLTNFVVPHQGIIISCSRRHLFLDNHVYVSGLMVGIHTALLVGIVVSVLRTGYKIWVVYFKNRNKITPVVQLNRRKEEPLGHTTSTTLPDGVNDETEVTSLGLKSRLRKKTTSRKADYMVDATTEAKKKLEDIKFEVFGDMRETECMKLEDIENAEDIIEAESIEATEKDLETDDESCCPVQTVPRQRSQTSTLSTSMVKEGNVDIEDIELFFVDDVNETNVIQSPTRQNWVTDATNIESKDTTDAVASTSFGHVDAVVINSQRSDHTQARSTTNQDKSWEIRAFATCVLIAATTVGFTLPMVVTFWVDLFSESFEPPEYMRFFILLRHVNALIEPFLFAWRIVEIREEFKKVFDRCRSNQE